LPVIARFAYLSQDDKHWSHPVKGQRTEYGLPPIGAYAYAPVGSWNGEVGKVKAHRILADEKRQVSGFGFQVSDKNGRKGGIK